MSSDTTWLPLGTPRPRGEVQRYLEHPWRHAKELKLPVPDGHDQVMSLFAGRRSARCFDAPTLGSLSALLWSTCACQESAETSLGFAIERRGAPSAGAIHPVHVLLCDPAESRVSRYNGKRHALQLLDVAWPHDLIESCRSVVPSDTAWIVLFVAEFGKTAAKYEDAFSLILRDAGVLQGVMAVAAEALDMSFCLLGLTGDPWVSSLSEEGKLRGVGAALLGSRA